MQSGERRVAKFVDYVLRAIEAVKNATISNIFHEGARITLCVGEQDYSVYKRFFDAGAERYLLRIETSSKRLFEKIHPTAQSFESRVESLSALREIGYQTGTGVMIGLPGQTLEDLAADVVFFREIDADMFGMGPFIPTAGTRFERYISEYEKNKSKTLQLALNMIAATRIVLPDANIASTTALDALSPKGRELGLKFGANVLMPVFTPPHILEKYGIYDGKADASGRWKRIDSGVSERFAANEYGDSKRFHNRIKKPSE